jgi:hypothetical protein
MKRKRDPPENPRSVALPSYDICWVVSSYLDAPGLLNLALLQPPGRTLLPMNMPTYLRVLRAVYQTSYALAGTTQKRITHLMCHYIRRLPSPQRMLQLGVTHHCEACQAPACRLSCTLYILCHSCDRMHATHPLPPVDTTCFIPTNDQYEELLCTWEALREDVCEQRCLKMDRREARTKELVHTMLTAHYSPSQTDIVERSRLYEDLILIFRTDAGLACTQHRARTSVQEIIRLWPLGTESDLWRRTFPLLPSEPPHHAYFVAVLDADVGLLSRLDVDAFRRLHVHPAAFLFHYMRNQRDLNAWLLFQSACGEDTMGHGDRFWDAYGRDTMDTIVDPNTMDYRIAMSTLHDIVKGYHEWKRRIVDVPMPTTLYICIQGHVTVFTWDTQIPDRYYVSGSDAVHLGWRARLRKFEWILQCGEEVYLIPWSMVGNHLCVSRAGKEWEVRVSTIRPCV